MLLRADSEKLGQGQWRVLSRRRFSGVFRRLA
jgi:hypothetical protein